MSPFLIGPERRSCVRHHLRIRAETGVLFRSINIAEENKQREQFAGMRLRDQPFLALNFDMVRRTWETYHRMSQAFNTSAIAQVEGINYPQRLTKGETTSLETVRAFHSSSMPRVHALSCRGAVQGHIVGLGQLRSWIRLSPPRNT